jgi:hypothetical protein
MVINLLPTSILPGTKLRGAQALIRASHWQNYQFGPGMIRGEIGRGEDTQFEHSCAANPEEL